MLAAQILVNALISSLEAAKIEGLPDTGDPASTSCISLCACSQYQSGREEGLFGSTFPRGPRSLEAAPSFGTHLSGFCRNSNHALTFLSCEIHHLQISEHPGFTDSGSIPPVVDEQ